MRLAVLTVATVAIAAAQCPPAAVPTGSMPSSALGYSDLYCDATAPPGTPTGNLDGLTTDLGDFRATIDAAWAGAGGALYPWKGVAQLSVANSNNGPGMFQPDGTGQYYIQHFVTPQIAYFKNTLGVWGVAIEVSFPMLCGTGAGPSQDQCTAGQSFFPVTINSVTYTLAQWETFYGNIASVIRSYGLAVIVEAQSMIPSGLNSNWNPALKNYYACGDPALDPTTCTPFTLAQYETQRAAAAGAVANTMHPDYFVLQEEPDTEANQSGFGGLACPGSPSQAVQCTKNWIAMYNGSAAAVAASGFTGTKVGAGFGSWFQGFSAYATALTTVCGAAPCVTSLPDFFDIHIYPLNELAGCAVNPQPPGPPLAFSLCPYPNFQSNALNAIQTARNAGLHITMSQGWLRKVRDTEWPPPSYQAAYGTVSGSMQEARETYSFWIPLDELYLQAIVDLANWQQFFWVAPFNTQNMITYLDFNTYSMTGDGGTLTPAQQFQTEFSQANAGYPVGTVSAVGTFWYNLQHPFAALMTGNISMKGNAIMTSSATGAVSPFNAITTTFATFNPANIPGMPNCATSRPCVGYQGGDLVDAFVLYYPWEVLPSTDHISNGVVAVYDTSKTFTNTNAWAVHDMQSDNYTPLGSAGNYAANCPSTAANVYCPANYNSGIVVGNTTYVVPGESNSYPVFPLINAAASGGPAVTAAYSYANGTVISGCTGWATGVYDGSRYIYYAPTVACSNWVRHDTSLDTGGVISTSGWSVMNLKTLCGYNSSFLGSVYDGHGYVYGLPGTGNPAKSIIVRFLASAFGAGVTCDSTAGAEQVDMTLLGQTGQPAFTGNGMPAQMLGSGGGVTGLAGDTNNGTLYLYWIPWNIGRASTPVVTCNSLPSPVAECVATTVGRVAIGKYTGGNYAAMDPTAATATWELFDLATLSTNPAFLSNAWNALAGTSNGLYTGGDLAGQSILGGYQLGFWDSVKKAVVLNASDSMFEVQHDPTRTLNDPSAWTLSTTDENLCSGHPCQGNNEYGGAYVPGAANSAILYPSPAQAYALVKVSGL